MRVALVIAVWAVLVGAPYAVLGPGWASVWLVLGLLGDKLCQREAKCRGEQYKGPVQLAAYAVGPPIVVLAAVFAAFRAALHLVRH